MCSPRPSYKGGNIPDYKKVRGEKLVNAVSNIMYAMLAEWNREDEAARAAEEKR